MHSVMMAMIVYFTLNLYILILLPNNLQVNDLQSRGRVSRL